MFDVFLVVICGTTSCSLQVKQSLRARGKQPDPEVKPKGKGRGRGRKASTAANTQIKDEGNTNVDTATQHSKEDDKHVSEVEGQQKGEPAHASSPVKAPKSEVDDPAKRKVEQPSPSKPSPNKAPRKRRVKKEAAEDESDKVKTAWNEQDCMHHVYDSLTLELVFS